MDFFYKHKTIIFAALFVLLSVFLGFIVYTIIFHSSFLPSDKTGSQSSGKGFPSSQEGKGQVVDQKNEHILPTSTEPSLLPEQGADETAKGGITKTQTISNEPSSYITKSNDGKSLQYYNQNDGKFYKINSDGTATALSDRVFYDVQSVSWSNGKDKAVIEYPDGANIVYDFAKEKSVTLPKHWEEFQFSPDDKQIAAKSIGLDAENRWLLVSNADGSNAQKIKPMGEYADTVYTSWSPNNQSIAMFTDGIDANRQNLYFVGKNDENFKSTVIEGRGFEPLWSNDGKQLLYSVYSTENSLKPMLWIVDAVGDTIGQDRKSLEVETWADKCSFFNSSTVYCAVPKEIPEGAGMFKEAAKTTDDYIYKIDLKRNTKQLVAIPDQEMTISNIVVSADEKTLFFNDNADKKIHKINL